MNSFNNDDLLPQTKRRWTAAPAPRTQSSTTCSNNCSPATVRWRRGWPVPSASTTTSSWSSSAGTPPASTAAQRLRPARSAGRPSASGSSCLSELLSPLSPENSGGGHRREARLGMGSGQLLFWTPPVTPTIPLDQPTGCLTIRCCIKSLRGHLVFRVAFIEQRRQERVY